MVFLSYEEKPGATTHVMGYSVDARCRPESGPACLWYFKRSEENGERGDLKRKERTPNMYPKGKIQEQALKLFDAKTYA